VAVALCHLAIERLDFFGLGHEQMRVVWKELMDAAMRQAISREALAEVREFLKAHWKSPAAKAPRLHSHSRCRERSRGARTHSSRRPRSVN